MAMDERLEKYIKKAKRLAKEYLRKRRGYKTKEEKKAFRIAEKLRVQAWKDSLAALDEAERARQLKAYSAYRAVVDMKLRLAVGGAAVLVIAALALIILL